MKHGLGVVIGKFYPPHRGHHFLINTAIENADRVTVIVCARADDNIPGGLRGDWLREIHPKANVMVIDDVYDPNDSRVWAENTIRWLGRAPDVVFTSEDYGEPYARWMNCRHVLVDRERSTVPCSGTAIRNDPYANWEYIEPPVRAWFAKRVCVLGAESTGTTTLAKALAAHYSTAWVPEYGREYCERKFSQGETKWSSEDFLHIAQEQKRCEDLLARQANRLLICDTNVFATKIWHRRYMGFDSEELDLLAASSRCDLYLLTGDEIPFVQDGLRDGELIRHEMHQWFVAALEQQEIPWRLIAGTREERVRKAIESVEDLFRQRGKGFFPGSSG